MLDVVFVSLLLLSQYKEKYKFDNEGAAISA